MGPHLWGLQVVLLGVLALGLRMVVFHDELTSAEEKMENLNKIKTKLEVTLDELEVTKR